MHLLSMISISLFCCCGVYLCEYRDHWEKFSVTFLPESHLSMKDITDAGYKHRRRAFKYF